MTFFYDGLLCSNSAYPKPWSFRVRRTTTGWDGFAWYPEKATIWLSDGQIKAMNPAHILYEVQTNRVFGRGFSTAQLDETSFRLAADQLYDEEFGLCLAWRRQDTIYAFIQEILDHIGAALFVDRMTGLWKLSLIRDNYQIASLPHFNFDCGLLRVEEDNNTSNDLVTNQTIISYVDPISNETRPARAENLAAIQRHGIILENKTYTGIPTLNLAGRVAARDMKIAQSHLKRFKVVLDRRAYMMQPTSVFVLQLQERRIESIVLRAIRVEHGELTQGEITITAVQDVFGLPATNFIEEQASLWQPPNLNPVQIQNARLFETPYAQLLDDFTVEEVQRFNGQNYFLALAQRPNSLQNDFNIMLETQNGHEDVGEGQFVFTNTLKKQIDLGVEPIWIQLTDPIHNTLVFIGQAILIDDEILRIDAIDTYNQMLLVARGCIDTLPTNHQINGLIWFYGAVATATERRFSSNENLSFKLLARTRLAQCELDDANRFNIIGNHRAMRPYPPAHLLINGLAYPDSIQQLDTLSWQHRHRIAQGTRIVDQTDLGQNIESNVSYCVQIDKKIASTSTWVTVGFKDNLINSTLYINPASPVEPYLQFDPSDASMYRIQLWSVLNGLESLQRHYIELVVAP